MQAAGDPVPPADLASWFTERAFHFYVASLRLPARAMRSARHAARDLRPAFADLDAACTQLRQADGMASMIVTARGRAAVAAALWTDRRSPGEDWPLTRADALILSAPAWPDSACPAPEHRLPGPCHRQPGCCPRREPGRGRAGRALAAFAVLAIPRCSLAAM